MIINQQSWGVIVGDIGKQPLEATDRLAAYASQYKGIYCGATRLPDSQIAYRTTWLTGADGIGVKYSVIPPTNTVERTRVPFGPLLFINQDTWDFLGGWPPLPNGDAYGYIALGLKCYFTGVPMRVVTDAVLDSVKVAPSLLNAHFVHAAYFSEDVYEGIWRPMLLHKGYMLEIDEVLGSEESAAERRWLAENRTVAEELFFRKALWSNAEDLLDIDRDAGRVMPLNLAAYVAYEARRSPGREWGKDLRRQRRHIDWLLARLKERGIGLSGIDMLDIGSRDGWSLEELSKEGFDKSRLTGLEISPWPAMYARSVGRNVLQGDAHDLSRWQDKSFDVADSWHNLEHCHSPLIVLKEIHRVLRNDGLLMIVLPIERKGISTAGDHCHAFRSPEAVIQLAREAGFECVADAGHPREFTGLFVKQR